MRPVLHEKLFPPAAAPLFAVLAKTNRRIYQEHRFTLSENENRNLGNGKEEGWEEGQTGGRLRGGGGGGWKKGSGRVGTWNTVSWRIRIFNCIEEVPRFFSPIEFNPTF
jgi:hypothetical protein